MTPCDSYVLSRYLDDGLALEERVHLEKHLGECAACKAELEQLRRVDHILAAWGSRRRPVPLSAHQRIARAVDERRKPLGRRSRIASWSRLVPAAVGTSMAAMLVFVSVNIGLLEQGGVPAASSPSQSSSRLLAQQSRKLTDFRRTSAILQGHPTTQQVVVARRTLQADAY